MSNIDDFKKNAEKRVGHNVVTSGATKESFTFTPTGIFLLDFALMGGLSENKATTLVGKKGAGKSTAVYKMIGQHQKKFNGVDKPKKYAFYFNQEQAFDPTWAEKNGVNLDELILVTPTNADEAVDLAVDAFANDDCGFLAFDSIPALVGGKELEKSMADSLSPGSVALYGNRMMRAVSSIVSKSYNQGDKKIWVNINQWRDGIGSSPNMPRTMPGGKYIGHYVSTEIEIYNKEIIGRDELGIEIVDHNEHTFKIHKNRAGNSIREGAYEMIRNTSSSHTVGTIDDFHTVARYAQNYGQLGGAGKGWWVIDPTTGEELKFGSKSEIVDMITEKSEFYEAMKTRIIGLHRKKHGLSETGWY